MNETCTDCGERATCEYDWGTGLRRGCAAHDPLRFGATMARMPPFYRTIFTFPVLATTGHLGICNCAYGTQTAVCPVHPPVRPMTTCGTNP